MPLAYSAFPSMAQVWGIAVGGPVPRVSPVVVVVGGGGGDGASATSAYCMQGPAGEGGPPALPPPHVPRRPKHLAKKRREAAQTASPKSARNTNYEGPRTNKRPKHTLKKSRLRTSLMAWGHGACRPTDRVYRHAAHRTSSSFGLRWPLPPLSGCWLMRSGCERKHWHARERSLAHAQNDQVAESP